MRPRRRLRPQHRSTRLERIAQYIIVVYMLSTRPAHDLRLHILEARPRQGRSSSSRRALFPLYLLQIIYLHLGAARPGLALEGSGFLPFYVPVLAGACVAFLAFEERCALGYSTARRAGPHSSHNSCDDRGGRHRGVALQRLRKHDCECRRRGPSHHHHQQTRYAIGTTTQELQKPSFPFLFASFGLELHLLPLAWLIFSCLQASAEERAE